MESVYLYTGKEYYLIKKEIAKILSNEQISEFEQLFYDANETSIENLMMEIKTISLFEIGKVIVVDNISGYDKLTDEQLEPLISFIQKPFDQVILIFITESIDSLKSLADPLIKHAYLTDVKSFSDEELKDFVKSFFISAEITIGDDAVNEIITRCGNDLFRIDSEATKLVTFALSDKKITKDDVRKLVEQSLDDNIYDLSQALLEVNKPRMIQVFYDLLAANVDPLVILNHLVHRIQEILYTQTLTKEGYTKEQLMQYFNISSGRVFYMMKNAKQISQRRLETLYKKLAETDFQIKSGRIDKRLGLELLLLGEI